MFLKNDNKDKIKMVKNIFLQYGHKGLTFFVIYAIILLPLSGVLFLRSYELLTVHDPRMREANNYCPLK